jgi:serine/threonine protein kinase
MHQKLDTSDPAHSTLLIEEFQRELEALHKMRHPNIVQVIFQQV